jgi:hypothetical protein
MRIFMNINKLFGILLSLTLIFMVSCYDDSNKLKIPFIPGNAVSGDTATDTSGNGATVTDPTGGDTGGTTVPGKKLSIDDVKNIINSILLDVNPAGLMLSLKAACVQDDIILVDKDTLKVEAKVTCDPFTVVLTITLKQYLAAGIDCGVNGVMTIRSQFPTNALGTYLLTINTPEGSPITTGGGDCGNSTIALSGLSMSVTLEPYSAQFSGTVVVGDEVFDLSEFSSPADILAMLKDAIDKIPWDEVLQYIQNADLQSGTQSKLFSGLSAGTQSASTYTVYNSDGLKADVGLSLDFSNPGVIIDLTFTNYKIDAASSTSISGNLNIFVTLETWKVLKLVCNTGADAPLKISGIPLITPKIGLAGVTLNYDWVNQAIVSSTGDSGTITLNGMDFDFDPSWITTIADMLD